MVNDHPLFKLNCFLQNFDDYLATSDAAVVMVHILK